MVFDCQLIAEVFERIIVELLAIVRDKGPRDPKLADDALPNEVTDILFHDSCQWFCLYPFGEVVDPNNKELELLHCHRKGSHDIESLLSERPWGVHQGKWFGWFSYNIIEALALVTCLHVGLGILLHYRPIVPCSYELVDQRSCP